MEESGGLGASSPTEVASATTAEFQVASASNETYPNNQDNVEVEMASGERMALPGLKALLRRQLEYYFSRENLATDEYLQSQMDTDGFVAISTVAKFNQVRRLTDDHNLVVEVLRESAVVQVDESGEKVRPNPRSGVLILREIPESTPIKELEDLFSSENCPKFLRCEFAHNNSWYVLFESDDDTQKAYRYLREEAKTFKGKPVMARIKAKAITSAPFTTSYKNGANNVQEQTDTYNAQSVSQQQQPQQQQAPLQYTTYNVSNEGYSNQQVCPPFYPPTMLQAWAPTTPACVDLGTVLSVNGLSPQAAFRPLNNNTNRSNYTPRDSEPQRYYGGRGGQQQQFVQQRPATLHQQSFPNIVSANSFDYYARSRVQHGFGVDMNFFTAPNLYYSKIPPSLYPQRPVIVAPRGEQYATAYAKEAKDVQVKENWAPNQRRPHNKRWWKENGTSSNSGRNFSESSNGTYSKSVAETDPKPDSPKFDLETSSFPPLPGCLEPVEVEVYESRLSDIVKGTVKTRDSKTQTSAPPPESPDSSVKEAEVAIPEPAETCPPAATTSEVDDWEDLADDLSSISVPAPSPPSVFHSIDINGQDNSVPSEDIPTSPPKGRDSPKSKAAVLKDNRPKQQNQRAALPSKNNTESSSGKDSAAKTVEQPVIIVKGAAEGGKEKAGRGSLVESNKAKSLEGESMSVNGHVDSESTVSSEDEKQPLRKLTYSEVAMRAKEKVEKIALELKEKERHRTAPSPGTPSNAPPPSTQQHRPAPKEVRPRAPLTEAPRPPPGGKEWRRKPPSRPPLSLPAATSQ